MKFASMSALLAASLLALSPLPAKAADLGYNTASGNWTTAANWNPFLAAPVTGDRVFLGGGHVGGQAPTTNVTINTDESAQTISEIWVGSLGVGGANSGTLTIQTGAKLKTNARMRVGGGVNGIVNQSGGDVNWVGGDIVVGDNSGGSGIGTYTMTGGTINNPGSFYLGNGTAGTFNNQGGTINASSATFQSLSSTSTYDQDSGSASFSSLVSGGGGAFIMNLDGGTFTTSSQFALGANSTVTQTAGTLNAGPNFRLGYNGAASYNLSGTGVINMAGEFFGGEAGTQTFTMTGGTINHTSGRFIVGVFSQCNFDQSGGTVTTPLFQMGLYGGSGDYNLSGGALVAATMQIGVSNPSTFDFTGGALDANSIQFSLTNAGGALSPGLVDVVDTTTFTAANNYTQSSGSLAIDLASPGSFDFVSVGGAASLNGTVSVNLVGAYIPAINQFWDVLTASSPITDLGLTVTSTEGIFTKSYVNSGNTLRLTYVGAVPEPSSLALLGIAGMLILRWRRRFGR